MVKIIFPVFFILLFISARTAVCEPPVFQNTAAEMVDSLTQQPDDSQGFSKTRGFKSSPVSRTIVVKERLENKTVEKTIKIFPDQPSAHANLKIEFDVNSCRIRPENHPLLKELGTALTSDALVNKSFYINGHTDSDGPSAYNLDLSVNRAQSVKEFLVENCGIGHTRLKVMGYGEAMPLRENTTAWNKQINRRVEIKPAD